MDDDAFAKRSKRLLVITRFPPLNGSSGAGTYLFSILRYLHQNGIRISVCWSERPSSATRLGWYLVPRDFARVADLIFPESLAIGRLRLFPLVWWLPFKARCLDAVKKTLFALGLGGLFKKLRPAPHIVASNDAAEVPVPDAWDRPLEPAERAFFTRWIARLQPQTLLFNFCWMTPVAENLDGHYLKITLTNDLRHIYSRLVQGRIQRTEGEMTSRELEQRLLRASNTIVAIREDDGAVFRQLLDTQTVLVAPPSFVPSPGAGQPIAHRCLFVASDSGANREGIAWFLQHAWPLVRAAIPDAELHVCGPICNGFSTDAPGVVLRGYVDSLAAEYEQAAVVLVPLLCGSGVKIKLMEALAHGKACVTTPIGVEGMPALEPCVLCAGTPEEFSRHVVLLLNDDHARRQLETRALATIKEKFSPAACYGPLCEHIINISSQP